jgi:phosphohistidine phosphatase
MPHLYLLRHAKSSWDDPALADRDRPLASRGRKAAARVARYIELEQIAPELVLCSPARRCLDTLEAIRAALGEAARVEVEEALYGAGSGDLLRRLRKVPAATASVLFIGHSPAIQELALMLARDADDLHRLRTKFPTAALVILDVPGAWKDLGAAPAVLEDFVVPRSPD